MQTRRIQKWKWYGFWVSLCLHLILLFLFTVVILPKAEESKKPPNLFVPSYTYTGKVSPSVQPVSKQVANAQKLPNETQAKKVAKSTPVSKHGIQPKSMMLASLQALQQMQRNAINAVREDTDPIYLVGDESTTPDPLVKLLGKALSVHFAYPQTAGEFGIKGRVIIGLTLHPDGHISDVQLLRGSESRDLDSAALYAVNSAPSVLGADRFLSEPKHFVVGFIFR